MDTKARCLAMQQSDIDYGHRDDLYRCDLELGHAGSHRANGVRWEPVDYAAHLTASLERISELEAELKEAWEQARNFGEEFGITADHLPALICGCGDKALNRISELEAEVERLRKSRALSDLRVRPLGAGA